MVSITPAELTSSSYPDTTDLSDGGFAMFAPAKINLGLRILGQRADGYHDLDTLFQEIDWCDRLEFRSSSEWNLEIVGADLDPGESNLITRAARILSEAAAIPCQARITLHKQIPVGGGLGGGSSNAAIALMGLSRLWGLRWRVSELAPLASRLGSDCAFFLHGGLARGRGRGEVLEPLPGRLKAELLLVIPPFGVSTAWAYGAGHFPLTHDVKSVILWFYSDSPDCPLTTRDVFSNDLENIVLSAHPQLAEIRDTLTDLGAEAVILSGSGSSMVGIFGERSRAEHAAQQFGSPFQVRICRTMGRSRLV